MPKFPLALSCNFYFASQTVYRQHFEDQDPIRLTEDEFDAAIMRCEQESQKYVIVYEHQLFKKLDYWDAFPMKIDMDELEFWYTMQFINEFTYLKHKTNLIP